MYRRPLPLLSLVLLAVLTACSQGLTSTVPASAGAGTLHPYRAHARLTIKVPRRHKRHGRYVSPATASLAYSIDGVVQTPIAISTSNPDCTVVGPISYLTCSVPLTLSPGMHAFSFTAKDANGTALSANTNVSYTVIAGEANQIPVTLGGIAASLSVTPPVSPHVSGDQFHGFSIYGNTALNFTAVAIDADGNFIVGPGAPEPVVSATPASTTLATPPPSAPNTIALTSTYQSTDPAVAQSSSITVVATPVPNSGGTTVTTTIPLALYQPWVYVVDDADNTVKAFDEEGNAKTTSGGFPGLSAPNGIAYDAHTGFLYVGNSSPAQVQSFDRTGHAKSVTMADGGPDIPQGLAYDPNIAFFYVSYASAGPIQAFNESGALQTLSAAQPFSGPTEPIGIAYVPTGNVLYVADLGGHVDSFDEQGNATSTTGFSATNTPEGLAYDSHDGFVYVVSSGNGSVSAFDLQGNLKTLSAASPFAGLDAPASITYDAYADWFYVGGCASAPDVQAFDAQGNAITTASNWPGQVTGLTVVP